MAHSSSTEADRTGQEDWSSYLIRLAGPDTAGVLGVSRPQPRPTNGIWVALAGSNGTLASRGRWAMDTTALAACPTSIVGSTATYLSAWGTLSVLRAVIPVPA